MRRCEEPGFAYEIGQFELERVVTEGITHSGETHPGIFHFPY